VRCTDAALEEAQQQGRSAMTVLVKDLLLFSCIAALVTGIVLVAASLL
jgi:hypothetical protein